MTQPSETSSRLALLFAPGERLGWIFRDRRWFVRPFPEPPPVPPLVPPHLFQRYERAKARLGHRVITSMLGGLGVTFLLFCLGTCAGENSAGETLTLLAGIGLLGTVLATTAVGVTYYLTGQRLRRAHAETAAQHQGACAAWEERRAAFLWAEHERVDAMIEWGAARTAPDTRRIDVVGGSLWGWEAFLTVFGSSMMGTRGSLTVLDLSGELVCAELVRLSAAAGAGVDVQRLPGDLAESDLLVGLDRRQFVDALVESVHGGSDGGNRADRAMDDRLLTEICEVIGHDLTVARLAAALRTVMGEPGTQPDLADDERRRLADELFSDEYRRQAHGHLRRLESYIHPLRELGARREPRGEAFVSCVAVDSDGRNVRSDLLVDLIVQWTMRRMLAPEPPRTLVVVGGDELQRRHIERLSDICERRDVRLALLFRHLREASLQVLGGGAVAFMRLGNHEEATRAADFIGRHHKFVLSQLTRTLGGSQTHGETQSEGGSETQSLNVGTARSTFRNWSLGGGPLSLGRGRGRSTERSVGWSTTRDWSTSRNWAQETNFSNAATEERVYEYSVEPTVLQHLPDHALLLVEPSSGGRVVHPVEFDPSIIALPRSSPDPLPPVEEVTNVWAPPPAAWWQQPPTRA